VVGRLPQVVKASMEMKYFFFRKVGPLNLADVETVYKEVSQVDRVLGILWYHNKGG
jgi:hypothetical protein